MEFIIITLLIIAICIGVLILFTINKNNSINQHNNNSSENDMSNLRMEINNTITQNIKTLSEILTSNQNNSTSVQENRLNDMQNNFKSNSEILRLTVSDMLSKVDKRLVDFTNSNEIKLTDIRTTVENRLTYMIDENSKKLELMRVTVDEKLQKTLDDRFSQSFKMVSERLEQVYVGLGEMQTLASNVGDLKKVLSNVKTRGILGEIQLGSILEQILSKEQYAANVATKVGSQNFVEYAVKLPGDDTNCVYLPIDAKFPADVYEQLITAYDNGDTVAIAAAGAMLDKRIKSFAKDISEKYIDVPHTTEFGIMFLPTEGLYAEVVRRGLIEVLQREYKISITGPTTMAAFLNSLQMGFKTLAIQKRSSEVWNVLSAVKSEFDKFSDVLTATRQRLDQANTELDKLVGVRTRQIQRKLKDVSSLTDTSSALIDDNDE